jgi:hypothetical protein
MLFLKLYKRAIIGASIGGSVYNVYCNRTVESLATGCIVGGGSIIYFPFTTYYYYNKYKNK